MLYSVYYFAAARVPVGRQCEVRNVPIAIAINKFNFLTTNVAARVGLTNRVIIIDEDDEIIAEWVFARGTVWPKPIEGD